MLKIRVEVSQSLPDEKKDRVLQVTRAMSDLEVAELQRDPKLWDEWKKYLAHNIAFSLSKVLTAKGDAE